MALTRLQEALDRLMTSPTLRDARDVVRDELGLLGNGILTYLEEVARRLRQQGNNETLEVVEHWLGLVRMFRRYGVEEGYLEFLADALLRAGHEGIKRLLVDYPELTSDAAREYFDRREWESHRALDQASASKYRLALILLSIPPAGQNFDADKTPILISIPSGWYAFDAEGEFLACYVEEEDDARRHQYLVEHPELLEMPRLMFAEMSFQPAMSQAWADVEVVVLRNLYVRRAMFRRAGKVGAAQAIREYGEGAEWPDLLTG